MVVSGGTGRVESAIWSADVDRCSASETLRRASVAFGDGLAIACSLQKETSVLISLAVELRPQPRFFTLDTGLLFDETYAIWAQLEHTFEIEIEAWRALPLGEQEAREGPELWRRDPSACCRLRKTEPLRRALDGAGAWVTGMRRAQSPGRASLERVQRDRQFDLWKINPLVEWTNPDVDRHLSERNIPYHPLHDRGYESIGCEPCTVPGKGREGRWPGHDRTECGIHRQAT